MPPAPAAGLSLSASSPEDLETDLLILPVFEGEDISAASPGLRDAAGATLGAALETRELQGRPYEIFLTAVTGGWRARRVALVGAGQPSAFNLERLRRVATTGSLAARQRRVRRIAFVLRGPLDPASSAQAVAESLVMSTFSGDQYKSGERGPEPPAEMTIVAPGAKRDSLEAAIERGRVLGESCNLARQLCNEPSNLLTPALFAERGAAIAREAGLGVEILDEKTIEKLKMGLLLGVARGSAEPPRMLIMRHAPTGAPDAPVLGLVGKGITFDTGGISIKPAEGMERMKTDMTGGAAVIGAMRAISLLRAPIKAVGIVPMSENMPGGKAVKPGDVITGAGGKTVEVINTDAEGRLVLGDGLWYAQQLGATHLVDVATLTGACVVALGRAASGLFGQPDAWVDLVRRTGQDAGDRLWPMPLYDEYADQLRSEIADMLNTGGRPAGACTAAMFLKEFAGGLPWAHLDIAGTAWAEETKPWQTKGATGVAVRTLAQLAFTSGQWK
jgi:leucyl aminopeptidase